MTSLAAAALLLLSLGQSPQGSPDLRLLARDSADSPLVEQARRRPDDVRDALRQLREGTVGAATDSARAALLLAARRLAGAYALAWRDSFLLRQAFRFESLSPGDRQAKITADSLRLAGNDALRSTGVDAAMEQWRESLRRFEKLGDTAGIAASVGNLGAGFYLAQEFDSAETYLSRSRALAELMGDYRTAGNAIGTLASVSKDRSDLRRASELYASASEIRRRTGDVRGLAADQNNLGLITETLGDMAGARHAFEAALEANRSAGRLDQAATNLINLGNVATQEGDYAGAESRYREGLAISRERGNRIGTASALWNLGLLAMRRGTYRAAVTDLREAAELYRRSGQPAEAAAARQDLASALAAMGDLQRARGELQHAESLAVGVEANAQLLARLALTRADLALQFNQLAEAERQYRRAERLARSANDDGRRSAAQQGEAMVSLLRGSYPRALATLKLAAQTEETGTDRRAAALTRLLIAYAERRSGDSAAARQAAVQALDALHTIGDAAGEAAALGALADLAADARLPLTADSLYQRALALLEGRPAPDIAWQLHVGRAGVLRGRGALPEAAAELQAAIGEVERVSASLRVEERRAAFLADKWDAYEELALLERSRKQWASAFETSEELRARQMLDLLARGRIQTPANGNPMLTAQEQDLRRRIAELTRQLETAPDSNRPLRGPALTESAGATREALARAQEAYADLLIELREAQPGYAALVRGETATTGAVMSALAPDQAMLEYLLGDSTSIVFVVTRDSMAAIDLNVSRGTLADLIDFARGTLASPTGGAARQAWRAPLRRLFQYLLGPVEASGLLDGKRRLLVVPHGDLHYLPFAALVRPGPDNELLLDRYIIEYTPSASVWLRLRGRPMPPQTGGVLALAPRADRLPGSVTEVAAIGRIRRTSARVLVGSQATESAFRSLAPQQNIIHLATYGVLNKHNPLFSFVELGPGAGQDGHLEVHEVFGLALHARLVVLSACQTGLAAGALADVPAGDDWVGLVQAFLYSGASHVLATLWPVEDLSTAGLMERFYQSLTAGTTEAEALALAQRAAAHDPATAHPFYWAGFALVTGR